MMPRFLSNHHETIGKLFAVLIFGVALWLLHHELATIHIADVAASFRSIPRGAILASLILTVANFAVFVGHDWLGTRLVDFPLRSGQVATVSFIYYAFSNAFGALIGGAPVRYRMYSAWGMPFPRIVRLMVLIAVAFWVGLFALSGALFVIAPFDFPPRFHLPFRSSVLPGVLLLAAAAAYFVLCAAGQRAVHRLGVHFQPPPPRVAMLQTVVVGGDFLLASAALYVLMPADVSADFLHFTAIYLLAILAGTVSHVPGGLGVLELILVTMLPDSSHGVVASLVAYRVIYYLLPLLSATVFIAVMGLRHQGSLTGKWLSSTAKWTSLISPTLVTGGVFVAGLILLVSGALPAAEGRMQLLRRALPLPVVELSHFVGSVAGALLLVLARALQRRIDSAWTVTVGLLVVGIVVSLAKGLDFEEASILSVVLAAMLGCRKQFFREGRLAFSSPNPAWLLAIVMVMGLTGWILLFAYRHIEYQNELWWSFAWHGDAPRALRALMGASIVVVLALASGLLRERPRRPAPATPDELAEAARIVARSESTNAQLALLGDKHFIFSRDREAVVMFGCSGKSWIAMGDPIGPRESADEAAWAFREACHSASVWPVFYQVTEASLGRYVEMGLRMVKFGEEAKVRLPDFSLEGGDGKDLRRTRRKMAEAGLQFEVIPAASVPDMLPTLKKISDAWLGGKSAAEKGFSMGRFSEPYLAMYDMAIVRDSKNEPIAFANLWRAAAKKELSVDLMRYLPDAPHGVMEYLFMEAMLLGKAQGYEWFNLGMAPLSGLSTRSLAPLWDRFSNVLVRHGEPFYNFRGLRNYKNKFRPQWFPSYIAFPGGLTTPRVAADVATLISGGVGGLIHR